MTETAFRVVVAGLYDRVATDPPITATDIKHGLLDLGFDGVTVTPMDDALQAENERLRALVIQYRDDLRRPPTGDSLERRLSAINQALEASHDA